MLRHPFAYPDFEPMDITATETDLLARLGLNFVNGAIDPHTPLPLSSLTSPSDTTTLVGEPFSDALIPPKILGYQYAAQSSKSSWSPNPGISHGVTSDELRDLKLDQWSRVPIDRMLAASAISLYLSSEHPLFGYFDPRFFIMDLQAGRQRFCSSLLVNALLCRACVSQQSLPRDSI